MNAIGSPEVILENLRQSKFQLFKHFKPSNDQLTFFIATQNKEADNKRLTRSSKAATPSMDKFITL